MQQNLFLLKHVKEKNRNTTFNVVYRPPNRDKNISQQFCKNPFSKNSKNLKKNDYCRSFQHRFGLLAKQKSIKIR